MKILLVDDHAIVRIALNSILTREGHKIVGECDNGVDAINKILELKPDVVVLDLDIPLIDGITVMKKIRSYGLPVKVMVYTSMRSFAYAAQCKRAGAVAFLSKAGGLEEIHLAVQSIASGRSYFPTNSIESVRRSDFTSSDEQLVSRLSARELTVLHSLVQGKNNMLIAREMSLSDKTISTYKARIMQKINASNLCQLINFAQRNDLI